MTKTKTKTLNSLPTKLIVGYAKSTRGPDPIARQNENLINYSVQTFGRPLDAFFKDGAGDGSQMAGSGIRALIEAAKTGTVAVVVVEHRDRISRNLGLLEEFEGLCHRMGIQLHTVNGGKQPFTPIGAYLNVERRELLKARIAAGRARAKAAREASAAAI